MIMKVYGVFTREAYEPATLDSIYSSKEGAMKRVEAIKADDRPYIGIDGEETRLYVAIYSEELEVKNWPPYPPCPPLPMARVVLCFKENKEIVKLITLSFRLQAILIGW